MCCSCVTRVSQQYLIVKGFLSIISRKNTKKSKFPVSKTFHKCNKCIPDAANLLRMCCTTPFLGAFRHTLHVAFYFAAYFPQRYLCIFLHIYSLTCIFQVQQTFVCAFCRPLPQPFSELQPAPWLYFLQQKTAQAAFSGPSVLCRIPYIKRRAAPKSRPPTIQAML